MLYSLILINLMMLTLFFVIVSPNSAFKNIYYITFNVLFLYECNFM